MTRVNEMSLTSSPRLVVSLTTTPTRINKPTLLNVLRALNEQTKPPDRIYLTLPKVSRRTRTAYPRLDPDASMLCTPIKSPADFGPVTKIVGALLNESDPTTVIVTCDDDSIFPSNMLKRLYDLSIQHNAVIGSSGMLIGQFPGYVSLYYNARRVRRNPFLYWQLHTTRYTPCPVDIVFGFSGVAYRRGFFPVDFNVIRTELLNRALKNRDVFRNDDVLLSFYMMSQHINRYLFTLPEIIQESAADGLSANMISFSLSVWRTIRSQTLSDLTKNILRTSWNVRLFHNLVFPPVLLALMIICSIVCIYKR